MKISKSRLKQIIKEEIANILSEDPSGRLKGTSDEILDMPLSLDPKNPMELPMAGSRREMAAAVKSKKGRHAALRDRFKQLEKQLKATMSSGPLQKDRKANIFDLKAAMKRTAHEIKAYDPKFGMPEWVDDPTWAGFQGIEKIPGMLDKTPSPQELKSIESNVSAMYGNVNKLEKIAAEGYSGLPRHLSDAYKKAAQRVLDKMIENEDYPQ